MRWKRSCRFYFSIRIYSKAIISIQFTAAQLNYSLCTRNLTYTTLQGDHGDLIVIPSLMNVISGFLLLIITKNNVTVIICGGQTDLINKISLLTSTHLFSLIMRVNPIIIIVTLAISRLYPKTYYASQLGIHFLTSSSPVPSISI